MQVGFWNGMEESEICMHLGTSSQAFWMRNADECALRVQQKFETFLSLVEVVAWFIFIWILLRFLTRVLLFLFVVNVWRPRLQQQRVVPEDRQIAPPPHHPNLELIRLMAPNPTGVFLG